MISLNRFFSILFCLLPFFMVSGPAIPDFIVVIFALYFVLLISKKKIDIDIFFKKKILLYFTIFYFYILIRSIFSEFPINSLESSLFYFRFLFFALCLAYLINVDNFIIKNFHKFLFVLFFILCIDGFIQFYRGENIIGYKLVWGRVSSFFGKELKLGNFIARLMPILIGLYLFNVKNKLKLSFLIILFVTADILIFISGERLAFALLSIQTLLFILCMKKYRLVRIFSLLVSSIIIIFILSNSNSVYERMVVHTQNQILNNEGSNLFNKLNAFSTHHQMIYSNAFKIFIDNPVFGIGTKLFRKKCFDYAVDANLECTSHPHNLYIQFLAETGIVGFLFLLSFLIYVLKRLIDFFIINNFKSTIEDNHDDQNNQLLLFIFIAIFINIFPFAPSFNFFNNWFSCLFFIPIAFLINVNSK